VCGAPDASTQGHADHLALTPTTHSTLSSPAARMAPAPHHHVGTPSSRLLCAPDLCMPKDDRRVTSSTLSITLSCREGSAVRDRPHNPPPPFVTLRAPHRVHSMGVVTPSLLLATLSGCQPHCKAASPPARHQHTDGSVGEEHNQHQTHVQHHTDSTTRPAQHSQHQARSQQ